MQLIPESHGSTLCITVEEARIDAGGAVQFKEVMRKLTSDKFSRIVLDLGKVSFVDSSGLGALVAVMKGLPTGMKLELAGIQPIVAKVLALTKMDQVFTIHASKNEALALEKAV